MVFFIKGKLAKRSVARHRRPKREADKKRKTSLLRKLSNKRASAEIHNFVSNSSAVLSNASISTSKTAVVCTNGGTVTVGSSTSVTGSPAITSSSSSSSRSTVCGTASSVTNVCSPPVLSQSRSFHYLNRSISSQEGSLCSPNRTPRSPPTSRLYSPSDSAHSTANSSQSSSPCSSVPNSPAASSSSHFQRPSTLHGLKHKLAQTFRSPHRRKSVGHIPLSPLARTPSPSPMPTSPTRSPSPLAFPTGHHPGSSNMTQTYSPGASLTPASAASSSSSSASSVSTTPVTVAIVKKGFARPKSAEPGSPLLRRALSPDRLHPRTLESKCRRDSCGPNISPLATPSSSPPPSAKVTASHGVTPKVTITTQATSIMLKEGSSTGTVGSLPPIVSSTVHRPPVAPITKAHSIGCVGSGVVIPPWDANAHCGIKNPLKEAQCFAEIEREDGSHAVVTCLPYVSSTRDEMRRRSTPASLASLPVIPGSPPKPDELSSGDTKGSQEFNVDSAWSSAANASFPHTESPSVVSRCHPPPLSLNDRSTTVVTAPLESPKLIYSSTVTVMLVNPGSASGQVSSDNAKENKPGSSAEPKALPSNAPSDDTTVSVTSKKPDVHQECEPPSRTGSRQGREQFHGVTKVAVESEDSKEKFNSTADVASQPPRESKDCLNSIQISKIDCSAAASGNTSTWPSPSKRSQKKSKGKNVDASGSWQTEKGLTLSETTSSKGRSSSFSEGSPVCSSKASTPNQSVTSDKPATKRPSAK